MSEYKIAVKFTRNLDDDARVLGKTPSRVSNHQLMLQFQKELQAAYDKMGIAGAFEIISVKR